MTFTRPEYHDMISRWQVIAHKLIEETATKEEGEEYIRLEVLLEKYFHNWRMIFSYIRHPYMHYIKYKLIQSELKKLGVK